MSYARKHLQQLAEDVLELQESQVLVRISSCAGGNLFHAQTSPTDTETVLVLLPNKFSKLLWLRRGMFCVVKMLSEEDAAEASVVGIIENVVQDHQLKQLRKEYPELSCWFETTVDQDDEMSEDDEDDLHYSHHNKPNFFDSDEDSC
ncbi:hypothetical protein RCL1_008105 [Eukaryota sp. TZLM3-RCL]